MSVTPSAKVPMRQKELIQGKGRSGTRRGHESQYT